MKQSHSRHNVFSKVDHDKSFIDKNVKESKNKSSAELPALQIDIRKRLASTQLSTKLSGKTAVTTVASGLGNDENEAAFLEQFGNKDGKLAYDDENASVASNHSIELENIKKSPELLKMEAFLDELGKVHVSDVEDDEESYDSEDSYGEFVERDRKKYTSTLDVHRKFMLKAKKKNTIADVKTIAAMKIMTHKKKLMNDAQNQNLLSGALSSKLLPTQNIDSSETAKGGNNTSAVAGASTGSLLGLASAAKSFLFLSKISSGAAAARNGSLSVSAGNSPQLTRQKSVANHAIPAAPADSPGSPSTSYTASPGGYAYSSKHTLLHDTTQGAAAAEGSPDGGRLKLFGKAPKRKEIAHRTFSATTLSNLHSKFDTTHSVLSATRDHSAVVKVAHNAPALGANHNHANTEEKPLYHVPELKSVHGKKTILGHLDKLFHAMTYQAAEPIPKPEPPAPPEPLSLNNLFKDQLIHTCIPENEKISDQAFNTLMNSTSGPANYGPRIVPDHSSPAAIVAQLDKALQRQRREEEEQKRRYENIAAAHNVNVISPRSGNVLNSCGDNDTVDYSMATFVTRLDQLQLGNTGGDFAQTAGVASKANHPATTQNSSFNTPPKLDLSKINPQSKPAPKSVDPYSIDVHALKLPAIMSPQTEAYYQQQRQPILCIYSPAPLSTDGSPSGECKHQHGSPQQHSASPPKSSTSPGAPVSRSSPIQLQGKLTATSHNHSSSSPAIMYISSPGLFKDPLGTSAGAHNKSTASLPIVSHSRGGAHSPDDNHMHHQYQTHGQYHQALHPQTQAYVSHMLSTADPADFHADPRNYRGGINSSSGPGSVADGPSVADIENSIYDYDLEAEDLAREPVGDSGTVSLDKNSSRILLPASTAQQGGEALLELGYQYQHSTNTYVHKDERNRSKFGQYQRSLISDPYAADFSDRQLQAILETTVGHGPPVVYIPPGKPAAEPRVDGPDQNHHQLQSLPQLTNGGSGQAATGAGGKAAAMFGALAQKVKAKNALSPGEVMQGTHYGGVRAVMQNPGEVTTSSIHYRGGGASSPDPILHAQQESGYGGDDYGDEDEANLNFPHNLNSADNSTLNSHQAAGGDIKREICDYIAKLAEKRTASQQQAHASVSYGGSINSRSVANTDIDNSTYNTRDEQAEKARVKLWDKLNNRYGGDREGEFVKKLQIKEYIYHGIKEDTQIMNEYLEEMEDGWAV